jgi:hypothetical protein
MGEFRRDAKRVRLSHGFNMQVVGPEGAWRRACTLLDVSDSGARLHLDGPLDGLELQEFLLKLSAIGNAHRRCKLVWKDGNYVGVRFLEREAIIRRTAVYSLS